MARRTAACFTVLLCIALVSIGCASSAAAGVFYVSPAGSDRWSGRSPRRPWRTVNHVNRARLRPGDVVEFHGQSTFSDAQLMPHISGAPGAPIRFTSYGSGRATLTHGIWFASIRWLQIDRLRLAGGSAGIGSGYGSGAHHIAVLDDVISDVGVGVNAANRADAFWTIRGNRIFHTGDSGVITLGNSAVIRGNQIDDTGFDRSIPWAKHGIYSKGPNARIIGNHIAHFSSQGISTRFHNAFIVGNLIRGGADGVGYWQQDSTAGTTVICANTISAVHYGVLIGPETGPNRERFRILYNHISTNGGPGVYVPSGHAPLSSARNVVSTRHLPGVTAARARGCPAAG